MENKEIIENIIKTLIFLLYREKYRSTPPEREDLQEKINELEELLSQIKYEHKGDIVIKAISQKGKEFLKELVEETDYED